MLRLRGACVDSLGPSQGPLSRLHGAGCVHHACCVTMGRHVLGGVRQPGPRLEAVTAAARPQRRMHLRLLCPVRLARKRRLTRVKCRQRPGQGVSVHVRRQRAGEGIRNGSPPHGSLATLGCHQRAGVVPHHGVHAAGHAGGRKGEDHLQHGPTFAEGFVGCARAAAGPSPVDGDQRVEPFACGEQLQPSPGEKEQLLIVHQALRRGGRFAALRLRLLQPVGERSAHGGNGQVGRCHGGAGGSNPAAVRDTVQRVCNCRPRRRLRRGLCQRAASTEARIPPGSMHRHRVQLVLLRKRDRSRPAAASEQGAQCFLRRVLVDGHQAPAGGVCLLSRQGAGGQDAGAGAVPREGGQRGDPRWRMSRRRRTRRQLDAAHVEHGWRGAVCGGKQEPVPAEPGEVRVQQIGWQACLEDSHRMDAALLDVHAIHVAPAEGVAERDAVRLAPALLDMHKAQPQVHGRRSVADQRKAALRILRMLCQAGGQASARGAPRRGAVAAQHRRCRCSLVCRGKRPQRQRRCCGCDVAHNEEVLPGRSSCCAAQHRNAGRDAM